MSRTCGVPAVLLLLVLGTARGEGEPAAAAAAVVARPAENPPPEANPQPQPPGDAAAQALEQMCEAVTAGDPSVACALWQRTWGQVGIYGYISGTKMAPDGQIYDPLFAIDLQLNVALNSNRSLYLYTESRFWAQKATEGVTNSDQGVLDFSKRQFDIDGGVAWNWWGPWEARAFLYSYNNLNRGESLTLPYGYDDGGGFENRYYFDSTNFDEGLYRFVSLGYDVTKTMIGGDGRQFDPGLFARASLALDIVSKRIYLYSDEQFITEKPMTAKLLLSDVGLAVRPMPSVADVEFRLGVEDNYDMNVHINRALFYVNARVVW